jgi:hypothetical protein
MGFADDIAQFDRLASPADRGRLRHQSPWLTRGQTVVSARVRGYLSGLLRQGIRPTAIEIAPISQRALDQFVTATLAGSAAIRNDPRFASDATFSKLAPPSQSPASRQAWDSAMRDRLQAVQHAAVQTGAVGFATVTRSAGTTSPIRSAVSVGATTPKRTEPQASAASPPTNQASPSMATADLDALEAAVRHARSALSTPQGRRLIEYSGDIRGSCERWNTLITTAQSNPRVRHFLLGIVSEAERYLSTPIDSFRRPTAYSEIPAELVDPIAMKAGANRDLRALAMSDVRQADMLRSQAVSIAIAWRYTQQQRYLTKLVEIMRCATTYRPLQRSGWSLTRPELKLASCGDGPSMATSWGLVAIADVLELAGNDLPASLTSDLRSMLVREIRDVCSAWAERIPWYVQRTGSISSNQWIDPNVGVIRACLTLGDRRLLPAYNMASENLARSLSVGGGDGSYLEGVSYAQMSMPSALQAIQAMRDAGDSRFDGSPYLQNSWKWWVHMLMPGGRFVNCYDSRMSTQPAWSPRTPVSAMIASALASRSDDAIRVIRELFPEGNATEPGIQYEVALEQARKNGAVAAFPTHAYFPSQQLVTWRTAFEPVSVRPSAFALWVRGGSALENHVHRDQGQVSVYCGNRAILLDCGTPPYDHPLIESHFASAAGHGIMQVGELRPRSIAVDAPITVDRLDDGGGNVTVDSTKAYVGADSCLRTVAWDRSGKVRIEDTARLRTAAPAGTELYRFHSGSTEALDINGSGGGWQVTWRGAVMRISASCPIQVDQLDWPDALTTGGSHRAIVIRAAGEVREIAIQSELEVDLSITE